MSVNIVMGLIVTFTADVFVGGNESSDPTAYVYNCACTYNDGTDCPTES